MPSTILCPTCQRAHQLFWLVSAKSRTLSYRCDKNSVQVKQGPRAGTLRRSMAPIPAPEGTVPDQGLPEYWTPSYRKHRQEAANKELPL